MKPILIIAIVNLLFISNGVWSSHDPESKYCYVPTKSNVSYSEILELGASAPSHVLNYGEGELQFGELWLPDTENPGQKAPLVVFVHGGCWSNAYDIKHSHGLSTALSKMGYAVWSIEYRRSGDPGGGWPGSLNDISKALDFMPELRSYPVDLRRIALVGHSAGGHLALLAGSTRKASLKGVIGLAAIVDIEKYAKGRNSCQALVAPFFGGSVQQIPEYYEAANPVNAPLHSNSLLIHGDLDSIVPLTQAQNSNLKLVSVNNAGHFDMIHPETKTFQVLLKELATILK